MVIVGFDVSRPSREDYDSFMSIFTEGFSSVEGVSVLGYGSYWRQDFNPGVSDIDMVVEVPGNVVTDKESLRLCSLVVSEALRRHYIPFQPAVSDRTTSVDGRFNSFTDDFQDYFLTDGVVVLGDDLREGMTYEASKSGELNVLSHNLRKMRNSLLFSEFYRATLDVASLVKDFNSVMKAVSRGSKQLMWLHDGNFRLNRFSAIETWESEFPDVNTEILHLIEELYECHDGMDATYQAPNLMIDLNNRAITCFEEMTKAYIETNPKR